MTNDVSITVLRTADGARGEVSLPLTATLDALKSSIAAQCPSLVALPSSTSTTTTTTIKKRQMRLFHLGRELKSTGRSLNALGIGRFENYLVHMQTAVASTGGAGATGSRKRKAVGGSAGNDGVGGTVEIDLSDEDNDEDEDEVVEIGDSQDGESGTKRSAASTTSTASSNGGGTSGGGGGGGSGEVIDLLDDSDDEDEDDDVAVVGTAAAGGGKRQRA